MQIVDVSLIEDCLDGAGLYRYRLAEPWAPERIRSLASFGDLEYFTRFPRPLFRVKGPGGALIQGLEGDVCCRVLFPRERRTEIQKAWEDFVVGRIAVSADKE